MPAESTHGDIHTGDVSGTVVVGDNNRVTNTTSPPEQPEPDPQPQQQSSAEDQAAVFAVQHGPMYVTYNAAAEREAEG
ncbi:hypothetical protein [Streptomyces sp. NBC_00078]|uniref:hypothetical protein n=1 Tax=unclassified Streptomyces TaxID=2593676 RepID=UPI00225271C1|nr:hypothetical protein [Streptomyces sp. NBC_00078]MCX5423815.1 hypothetical protein [Streptomyces sp. NBC_00078]